MRLAHRRCFDRESLSGFRAQGDLESIPSLPVARASGSSQVSVKEPIVGKSHKYEVNDLVSSGELEKRKSPSVLGKERLSH